MTDLDVVEDAPVRRSPLLDTLDRIDLGNVDVDVDTLPQWLYALALTARGVHGEELYRASSSSAAARENLRYARKKLDAKNTTEAVAIALRQGLIPYPERVNTDNA